MIGIVKNWYCISYSDWYCISYIEVLYRSKTFLLAYSFVKFCVVSLTLSDIPLSPVMEGYVILKKNPEYDEDDPKK